MIFSKLVNSNPIFKLAFTHPSAIKNSKLESYQRLEFLGDKILGFVLVEMLLDKYPNEEEGVLSVMLSNLVCTDTLAEISLSLGLGELLIIDRGEESLGGRENKKNLEDCLEALIGAVYQVYGMDEVKKFICEHWEEFISDKMKIESRDPKSKLQEELHKLGHGLPEYKFISEVGESHSPEFKYELEFGEYKVEAVASSKKEAQKLCAQKMLALLN